MQKGRWLFFDLGNPLISEAEHGSAASGYWSAPPNVTADSACPSVTSALRSAGDGDGQQMRQEASGGSAPDTGEAENVSVAGGIDCLLPVVNAICHCPSHPQARS
jgi:hypothetical protein